VLCDVGWVVDDLVELRMDAIHSWESAETTHSRPGNVAFHEHADSQIARLRSLSRRELRMMDSIVRTFVWAEDSPTFLAEHELPLFEHWLHEASGQT
jgi:hypothetical protein